MTNITAVDVFLGHPLVDINEKHFLARLRRDLAAAGVCARILANAQLGKDYRQVDFVVVTDARAVLVELKSWRDPVVGGANGRWQRLVDGQLIDTDTNGYRQAHEYGYALSDAMRTYARQIGAPRPRRDKYVQDLELYVCLYPTIRQGSCLGKHPHVRVVGYNDLLERLTGAGRSPAWQDEDWDSFIRFCDLYRDGEDDSTARALRRHAAAVDEYCARYVGARGDLPDLVPTPVGDGDGSRPDLVAELLACRDHPLWGPSGQGKSLWASAAAVELARAGHVPVWLPVRAYDEDFSVFLARAVAPYTTLAAAQLIASARAAGRHVVFVLDGLNERGGNARAELLAGVQALRLHAPSHAVLLTAQQCDGVPEGVRAVELVALDDDDRRAVLAAYGADPALADVDGLRTPLDLSVAAACAEALGPVDSPTELLDAYVDSVAGGEATRAVLRSVAWRMHEEVRLTLRAPDAARAARRDTGVDAIVVADALACSLLGNEHGKVAFVHERFAHFLAAEALLERCPDGTATAEALNQPRAAALRTDVLAFERDEGRLGATLASLHDPGVLVNAARGRLGGLAATTALGLLIDVLGVASTQTTSGLAHFEASEAGPFGDRWRATWSFDAAQRAQLIAAGRCMAVGVLVEPVARLFAQTDALSRQAERDAGVPEGWTFPATYAAGWPLSEAALPATLVFQGIADARLAHMEAEEQRSAAHTLMASPASGGPGTLLAAMYLLRIPVEEDAELVACLVDQGLAARPYHLRLEAFQLVHRSGWWLPHAAHDRVLAAVETVETDHIFLSSSKVEALGALGALEPMNRLEELQDELRLTLSRPRDANHRKLAAGAISSQFDNEDVLGPWCEAIESLDGQDRILLFAMALYGGDADSIATSWLLDQPLDLEDPRLRAAIFDFVANSDPLQWHSSQFGIANAVLAVRCLAAADLERPATRASREAGTWEGLLDLVHALARDDAAAVRHVASRLLVEHEDGVADLFAQLHSSLVVLHQDGMDLIEQVIAAFGSELQAVLIRSLERPDRQTSFVRWPHTEDRARRTIRTLADIGDARAADVLRRFVEDSQLGADAVDAVRSIELRV